MVFCPSECLCYLSFLSISHLIYHAAIKDSLTKEKDVSLEGKGDVTKELTFSDAVDSGNKDLSTTPSTVDSTLDQSNVKTTTVGYVEIPAKEQEKHFQTICTELESSHTDLNIMNKKKSSQHKIITMVMEQEGSPMESPMTESGQWTDTGISGISGHTGDTNSMSKLSKPNQLDLQDASIDTDLDDLSEMSPMNNEEVSTSQHQTAAMTSVSSDSQKTSSDVNKLAETGTIDKATSPPVEATVTSASSPMVFDTKNVVQQEEKGTSTQITTTCDVNLSPILFTESKATSPMSDQSGPKMVDASSSPPEKVVMTSAATSPPKPTDLPLRTKSSSPTSSKGRDVDEKDPLSFEFDLSLSAQDEVEQTVINDQPSLKTQETATVEISNNNEDDQSNMESPTQPKHIEDEKALDETFEVVDARSEASKEEVDDEGVDMSEDEDIKTTYLATDVNAENVENLTANVEISSITNEDALDDNQPKVESQLTTQEDAIKVPKDAQKMTIDEKLALFSKSTFGTYGIAKPVNDSADTIEKDSTVQIETQELPVASEPMKQTLKEDEHDLDSFEIVLGVTDEIDKPVNDSADTKENDGAVEIENQEIAIASTMMTHPMKEDEHDLDSFDIVSESELLATSTVDAETFQSSQKQSSKSNIPEYADVDASTEAETKTTTKVYEDVTLETNTDFELIGQKSSTISKISKQDPEAKSQLSDAQQSSMEDKLADADFGTVARDISNDSFGFEGSKSEEVDELLLLVMPPGQTKIDMKGRDDKEFDQINAPRITITPSLDEGDEDLEEQDPIKEFDTTNGYAEVQPYTQEVPSSAIDVEDSMQPVLAYGKVASTIDEIVSKNKEPISGEDNENLDKQQDNEEQAETDIVPTLCSLAQTLVRPETQDDLENDVQTIRSIESTEKSDAEQHVDDGKPVSVIEESVDRETFESKVDSREPSVEPDDEQNSTLFTQSEKVIKGVSDAREVEDVPNLCALAQSLAQKSPDKTEVQEVVSKDYIPHKSLEFVTKDSVERPSDEKIDSTLEELDVGRKETESQLVKEQKTEGQSIFQPDASKVADFRLMESFRSHYVIDSSVGEDILKQQHLIEEKEKMVDTIKNEEADDEKIEKQTLLLTSTKPSMQKMTDSTGSKVESVEDEQESGLEMTAGKEHKSYEDSSLIDHSSDLFGSDKTDSLLQESTMHDSTYTLEATDLPADTDASILEQNKFVVEEKGFAPLEKDIDLNKEKESTKSSLESEKIERDLIINEEKLETKFSKLEHITIGTADKADGDIAKQIITHETMEEITDTTESTLRTAAKSKKVASETKIVPVIERIIHDHGTSDDKKPIMVPSPITESVELTPFLSWQIETDKDNKIEGMEQRAMKQSEISGMSIKQLEIDSPRESTDSASTSPPNTSRCSSYMTDRSGTQSSIEVRSSSKSSHHTTSSRASSFIETESRSEIKSYISSQERSSPSGSSHMKSSSSPPKSSECLDEPLAYSNISSRKSSKEEAHAKERSSSESSKHVKLSDLSPEVAPLPALGDDDGSRVDSTSPPRKSPISQLQQSELSDGAGHSLPSSPRRLRRKHSDGVKKLTSELFSSEADISRSLEIVYVEPGEDSRRKLSDRYRHSSSSGNSDGSITHDTPGNESPASVCKLEKRKPSVTRIRKSSEVSKESSGPSSLVTTTTTENESEEIETSRKTSSSEQYDLQHKTETVTYDSYITKSTTSSPPPSSREKKAPSPTKIKPPIQSAASLKEQKSEEIISPVLEVESHTPEKSTKTSTKGKGGLSIVKGLR